MSEHDTVSRFWSKVVRSESCWPWTGKTNRGYGRIRQGPRMVYAHRFSWRLFVGDIPKLPSWTAMGVQTPLNVSKNWSPPLRWSGHYLCSGCRENVLRHSDAGKEAGG